MGDESGQTLREYARAKHLKFVEREDVEPLSPLLSKGDARAFAPALHGTLPGGLEGTLGRLSYARLLGEYGGAFTFTVVTAEIAESSAFVPRLVCERRGRSTDNVEFGFTQRSTKLWQESVKLNDRYVITIGPYQDENWMRQLFSPVLIDYLAATPPDDFSFELAYGTYCASVERDGLSTAELDELCEVASHVAARVRKECHEQPVPT